MADQYFVVCEKGHFTQEIVLDDIETPLVYLIDDKYKFLPLTTIAWCFSCNRVTQAENLPPLDSIEEAIHGRVFGIGPGLDSWLGHAVQDEVEQKSLDRNTSLKIKLGWRITRQSPPRCLECGSMDLDFGTKQLDGNQYFIHPDCGGKCSVNRLGATIDIQSVKGEWPLSGEGEHLTTLLERSWINDRPPEDKLIAFLTRLQRPKTIGGFSTSRRGLLDTEVLFVLITSLPSEYVVEVWIPRSSNAQQYYEQAKVLCQHLEFLDIGEEAFFASDVDEKIIALMRYEDVIVRISKMKSKKLRHYPELRPTVLTREQAVSIFEDILKLLIGTL